MSDDAVIEVGNGTAIGGAPDRNGTAVLDPTSLVTTLASGATDPMSVLLSQLQAQGSNNLTTALLATLLQRRKPPDPESGDEAEDRHEAQEPTLAQRERERSLQELRETVSRLYAELEVLRKRNDELAAAVGACFLCFGTDPLCSECAGRGRPGARVPEPNAYRKYVLPALRRAQTRDSEQSQAKEQSQARMKRTERKTPP